MQERRIGGTREGLRPLSEEESRCPEGGCSRWDLCALCLAQSSALPGQGSSQSPGLLPPGAAVRLSVRPTATRGPSPHCALLCPVLGGCGGRGRGAPWQAHSFVRKVHLHERWEMILVQRGVPPECHRCYGQLPRYFPFLLTQPWSYSGMEWKCPDFREGSVCLVART